MGAAIASFFAAFVTFFKAVETSANAINHVATQAERESYVWLQKGDIRRAKELKELEALES